MIDQSQKDGKWTESGWKNIDIDPKSAQYITAGIDVGSVSSQAVIIADDEIYAYANMRTGSNNPDSARNVLDFALQACDVNEDRLNYIIGTGYGRVNVPMADRTLTEVACLARGANYIYGPDIRTVLDVGGQDVKIIRCDEKGKVVNFLINDKCAAGTGRGMEVFADLVDLPLNDIGDRSLDVEQELEAVFNVCVVYAKKEAISLLRSGWSTEKVLAAYCRAMAERIFSIIEKIGIEPEFAVTGGMAKNRGVMDRLMPMLKLESKTAQWDAQLAGAVGAALFANALCKKGKGRK